MLAYCLLAAVVGAAAVVAMPQAAILGVVLAPFLVCIILGWVLTVQNRGLNLGLSGLILPIKPFTKVKPSRTSVAFGLSAAFAAGACFSLLLSVAYA
jgi:hypothetical protein